ncbi:unnamed protein product [Ophioblennius macclurei]
MTLVVHLLLLPLLCSIAAATDVEKLKGPFQNTKLDVPEGIPVPAYLYQFQVTDPNVNNFRLTGEGQKVLDISKDGLLMLIKPLDWSEVKYLVATVEAMTDETVALEPVTITINVLDVNNNAPFFNQSIYIAMVRENSRPGVPFTRVFASDLDDPETPNTELRYSLVSQLPSKDSVSLFQIDPNTGDISTTEEGEQMLEAREGFLYGKGEEQTSESLQKMFNDICPAPTVSFEKNPFYTCVEKAEMRRKNIDPLEDPDFTLLVRVQDLGGASPTALSGTARVHIVVQQNMWRNPGPLTIKENLKESYPLVIATVESNHPDAIYTLAQKEREIKFPFEIRENGDIVVTEELDREENPKYTLVVFAQDNHGKDLDPPMEIHVLVLDENDNAPECGAEESTFELQENEPVGSPIGQLIAHDADEEGTIHAELTYTIVSQSPSPAENLFAIDHNGQLQSLRMLQRKEHQAYDLVVRVSDSELSTDCKVVIKVIDVNNELPLFEKTDYGSHTLSEDIDVGHTILTISATDNDDPDSGSSRIQFEISSGDDDGVFRVETDGQGVGHLVVAKPLDFESSATYNLQIDARNPEPLMKGLEYGEESTAAVFLTITDVDEVPEFNLDIMDVTVPENITTGSELFTVEAKDPEGKDISFKLDEDASKLLEIDNATGVIKTKGKLDREAMEKFDVTVTVFEKGNPEKSAERVVHVTLLDVNDNYPTLVETQAFICMKNPKPVTVRAQDLDAEPFAQPFTFALAFAKGKSPNWYLRQVDDTSVELLLKKSPPEDKTFKIPINIKDSTGMGISHTLEVRVCNCTELGYCYTKPGVPAFQYGLGGTVGILVGIIGFCIIAFVVVIKRISKKNKKAKDEEERNAMM